MIVKDFKKSEKNDFVRQNINRMIYYSILLTLLSYDLPSPPTLYALNDLCDNLEYITNPAILESLESNIRKNKSLLNSNDFPSPILYILNACTLPSIKRFVHSSESLLKDPLPIVSEIWKKCIMDDDSNCSISTNNSYINISSIWQCLLYIYNKMSSVSDKFIKLCIEMFNIMSVRYNHSTTVNTNVFFLLIMLFLLIVITFCYL